MALGCPASFSSSYCRSRFSNASSLFFRMCTTPISCHQRFAFTLPPWPGGSWECCNTVFVETCDYIVRPEGCLSMNYIGTQQLVKPGLSVTPRINTLAIPFVSFSSRSWLCIPFFVWDPIGCSEIYLDSACVYSGFLLLFFQVCTERDMDPYIAPRTWGKPWNDGIRSARWVRTLSVSGIVA